MKDIENIAQQLKRIIEIEVNSDDKSLRNYKESISYCASTIDTMIMDVERKITWDLENGFAPINLIKMEGYRDALIELKSTLKAWNVIFNKEFENRSLDNE